LNVTVEDHHDFIRILEGNNVQSFLVEVSLEHDVEV